MIRYLIYKPVAVIMVFIALVILGAVSATQIPISPLPNVDIPEINIRVNRKNISASELEKSVVKHLRGQLQQVARLADIHTETRDGYAILKMRFNYGADINYAFMEVNEKIDLAMNALPRDIERPRVVKASAADLPVFYLNLRLRDTVSSSINAARFFELNDFANQVIRRRLEQLPEIAFVDITGVQPAEVYIKPDAKAMAALNISFDDMRRLLENNNTLGGNVSATDGVLQYDVKFPSKNVNSVTELSETSFNKNGHIFRLKDIATVGSRQQEAKGSFIANDQLAINLAIIKQPDAKMDDLREAAGQLVAGFEKEYPDIKFEQTQDQTELLDNAISNLKLDLLYGSLLAFVMMFFFLKNIRSPLLIGISIPVSLLLSILFFNVIHLTINIISLSGLVLGIGLMIDNSIIVIDNITQHREQGKDIFTACIDGANEVVRPMIASALTTCSVFLPLIFLSGISGALFFDQAMAITISLSVSLIVSITLLPVLFAMFHKRQIRAIETDFFERYGITFFERIYEAGFKWVFRHKVITLLIVIALMVVNALLFAGIRKEKLPLLEQTETMIYIDWNNNLSVKESARRVKHLLAPHLREIAQCDVIVGEHQYLLSKEKNLSSSEVQLYIKAKDEARLLKLKRYIGKDLARNYTEATYRMTPPKNIFEKVFGDDEPALVVQISRVGDETLPDKRPIDELVNSVKNKFPNAAVGKIAQQQTIVLNLNYERALRYDLRPEEVFNGVKNALGAVQISSIEKGQQRVPVVLSNNMSSMDEFIRNTTIQGARGGVYPLISLVSLSHESVYKTINGGSDGNYVPINIDTEQPQQIMRYLSDAYKGDKRYEISFKGSYFSNKKLIKEMAIVLAVAVLLLFFILAAQFESLVQPLIVLFELPISMSGALTLLYVFNSSINLISLIGLVVMCGIIINDSILKIDMINQLRKVKGYTLMDAIKTGGKRRLKSIVMTSMTTILSILPFLFGTDMGSLLQRPLSLALIGGMLIGTPVSLYFIPLVYWFYYDKLNTRHVAQVHKT